MSRIKYSRVALVVVMLLFSGAVFAATPFNVDSKGVAIKGYDPVAYFTVSKPLMGKNDFMFTWKGAKWKFSSEENKKLFMKNPEKYAPRYGGYCAYGVAVNDLFDIQPEAWTLVDGSLYLNKNLEVRDLWRKDIPGNIKKADMNWPGLMKK
jgi:YHS domain-containing protein